MREVNLRIDGMHCGACIGRATRSLQTVDGVVVEEVRLGAARLKLPAEKTTESLIACLGKAGFSAQEER